MSVPGSTNGSFNPLTNLHGGYDLSTSLVAWFYDTSTAWPQFHIERIYLLIFASSFIFIVGQILDARNVRGSSTFRQSYFAHDGAPEHPKLVGIFILVLQYD